MMNLLLVAHPLSAEDVDADQKSLAEHLAEVADLAEAVEHLAEVADLETNSRE